MKKILLISILLPSLVFGQCKLISEETLIGAEIRFTVNEKLLKNGQIREVGYISDNTWSYSEPVLKIVREDYSYFLDLSSGLHNNGRINKTWCKRKGIAYNSALKHWQEFDPNYHYLVENFETSYKICINNFISERIKIWEKKREFEKTIQFKDRVNENSRKVKSDELKKEAINNFKKEIIDNISSSEILLKEYNADNETFIITIAKFEAINFPVPISKAESFKKNFNPSNFSKLDVIYAQDQFIVSKIDIDGFSYDLFSQE